MANHRGHSFKICEQSNYENIQQIGSGAFGFVVSANKIDTPDDPVAIKKISDFHHEILCRRVLREIQIMKSLNHDNIIQIREIIRETDGKGSGNLTAIFIVLDYMEQDLAKLLSEQALSNEIINWFSYQLFCALKYIHSAEIIHRDLKPGNILINSACDLKICDFGLARVAQHTARIDPSMTSYVATRWYRAPEVLLSEGAYSISMDIWSVGCIIAEMISNNALFQGNNQQHQISLIFDFIGNPTEEQIEQLPNDLIKRYARQIAKEVRQPNTFFIENSHADARILDLGKKCLEFTPGKRISAVEALEHGYFEEFHDAEEEPVFEGKMNVNVDIEQLGRVEIIKLISEEAE